MSNIFIERLEQLCAEKGLSKRQVEQNAGIATGSISKWKKGNIPNQKSLQKLADYFDCTVGFLIGESDFKLQTTISDFPQYFDLNEWNKSLVEPTMIPVLGSVAAGVPILMNEDVVGLEEISPSLARTGEYFGLKIQGESMFPRISNGDIVIVKHQSDAESGDVVIVAVNGNEATCKKLIKHESGITLVPFNPSFEPKFFSNEEIQSIPITIIGKVIESRSKF